MRVRVLFFFLITISCVACSVKHRVYKSDSLQLIRVSDHTWMHITYLQTDTWGKVACNGLIYLLGNQAYVFDTPTDSLGSVELLNWIEREKRAKVSGIVINHFHNDCLGGLSAFHARGVKSYTNQRTIELATETSVPVIPQYGFTDSLVLDFQGQKIVNRFHGEGHTRDNIVSWLPTERVLFGGCMVKALGAGKGFLGDANVAAWSETARTVRLAYPSAKVVIPGHGDPGGLDLLEFTEQLFQE